MAEDMGVTGNAQLLLGYIAGHLALEDDPDYRLSDVDAAAGVLTVERIVTGNTFRISVVQLEGVE